MSISDLLFIIFGISTLVSFWLVSCYMLRDEDRVVPPIDKVSQADLDWLHSIGNRTSSSYFKICSVIMFISIAVVVILSVINISNGTDFFQKSNGITKSNCSVSGKQYEQK